MSAPIANHIASIREDYRLASLLEQDLHPNPIQQFQHWFQEALNAQVEEVNAMTLATVDSASKPHARIVLLKGIEGDTFHFYTNYESNKGEEIQHQPEVCLLFFWRELQRQVRIEGVASKLDEAASESYFHSRPIESQLGAWASAQSQPLASRNELETRFETFKQQYQNQPIPKPPHWGGYKVVPHSLEFWQGRPSRLHDRLKYKLDESKQWVIERLYP